MAKELKFMGMTQEQVEKLSMEEFVKLIPSRERRSIMRGYTDLQKNTMKKIREGKGFVKTHARDLVIVPEMLGKKIGVHNGKEFVTIEPNVEMLGHRLGEFALTRKSVKHSGPGVGATRSSKFVALK